MGKESANENNSKKRDRDDLGEFDLAGREWKRVNTGSGSLPSSTSPVSNGGEIDECGDFSLENGIPEDILDILDDVDTMPAIQDLDSVIRSFEEEILQASPSLATEFRSESGEYQSDLGYLLEASDDELGLPPTVSPSAEQAHQQEPTNPFSRNDSEVAVFANNMKIPFENALPGYDSFEFELGESSGAVDNGVGGFVVVDGLFDYSEQSEFSDFAWRPESLPAL